MGFDGVLPVFEELPNKLCEVLFDEEPNSDSPRPAIVPKDDFTFSGPPVSFDTGFRSIFFASAVELNCFGDSFASGG